MNIADLRTNVCYNTIFECPNGDELERLNEWIGKHVINKDTVGSVKCSAKRDKIFQYVFNGVIQIDGWMNSESTIGVVHAQLRLPLYQGIISLGTVSGCMKDSVSMFVCLQPLAQGCLRFYVKDGSDLVVRLDVTTKLGDVFRDVTLFKI
ncbi:uncharacterized protein LAESUDRAFT_810990 [Laetiporus sulphureus 93-53]|uniref:Uncharacterized protein n=1 Tax=Laetiporus sulphureus 93-53 TaxID=1314785 RepID=A0A165FTV8_9APHY|nr:uncharacterized protein LAESUDRAFT_810990 [Laetiporus sulphureus 93-53]KZT09406.1 hypothetical protein LAESUDRAFT_810990 [Laetiporus sulphureus 93-53]